MKRDRHRNRETETYTNKDRNIFFLIVRRNETDTESQNMINDKYVLFSFILFNAHKYIHSIYLSTVPSYP